VRWASVKSARVRSASVKSVSRRFASEKFRPRMSCPRRFLSLSAIVSTLIVCLPIELPGRRRCRSHLCCPPWFGLVRCAHCVRRRPPASRDVRTAALPGTFSIDTAPAAVPNAASPHHRIYGLTATPRTQAPGGRRVCRRTARRTGRSSRIVPDRTSQRRSPVGSVQQFSGTGTPIRSSSASHQRKQRDEFAQVDPHQHVLMRT
jgi:hypothetical protein